MLAPQFSSRTVFDYHHRRYQPSETDLPRLDAHKFAEDLRAKGLQAKVLNYSSFSAVVLDDVDLPHYSVYQREPRERDSLKKFWNWEQKYLDLYVQLKSTPEELAMAKELAKSPLRKQTEQFLARLFKRGSGLKSSKKEEKSLD